MFSRMSSTQETANEGRYVGTRLESSQKKRKAKMRADQMGFDSFSDYLRWLVDEDLEDAPDALHELVENSEQSGR